jgi:hypothetical protein
VDVRRRLRTSAAAGGKDRGVVAAPPNPPCPPGRIGRIGWRIGWGLADQALSSATNFAVGVLVARSVSTAAFGSFSLAFTTYLIALNVHRGLTTDPLTVRFSHVHQRTWRPAAAAATGTAFQVGVLFGIVCLVAGLFATGPLRVSLLAVGATMPGLVLQDAWRLTFFSNGKGSRAFLNDLVWASVQFVTFGILLALGHGTLGPLVLAWGGAACLAAAVGAVQARMLPRPSEMLAWLRAQRDLAPQYLGVNLTVSGASAVRMYGLDAVAGLSAVGSMRAAELLVVGPLNVAFQGIHLMAVPEAVRMLRRGVRRLLATCVAAGGGLALVALGVGTAVLLVPDRLGEAFLHEAWGPARTLLLPSTIVAVAIGLTAGAEIGLKALAQANRSFWARLLGSCLTIGGVITGGILDGAHGAVWGLAATQLAATLIWWLQLLRGATVHRPSQAFTPDPADVTGPIWDASTTSPSGLRLMIGDFMYQPPDAFEGRLPPQPPKRTLR